MSGLVESIQSDAINPSISVSTLLRKVKLAAAKLQLKSVEEWVECELNGYRGRGDVPEYRKIQGQPMAFNPYRGWIPIAGNPKTIRAISTASTSQSIATIEDLVSSPNPNDVMQHPLAPEIVRAINGGHDSEFTQMAIIISRSDVVAILDVVRSKILDWAIELERNGITGDGVSFDDKERAQAKSTGTIVNIGTIGAFSGNLGHGNASGSISSVQTVNEAAVFDQLADALRAEIGDEPARLALISAVAEMKKSKSDRPSFAKAYAEFMSLAADHVAIVSPFMQKLASFF